MRKMSVVFTLIRVALLMVAILGLKMEAILVIQPVQAQEVRRAIPPGSSMELNTDRPGMDYKNFDLSEARSELCQEACASDPNCRAYTYVKPGIQGPQARCWLKSDAPNPVQSQCCVSGVRKVTVATPPQGPAPFDLVWAALDPNGLPSNPRWGYWDDHSNGPLPNPLELCPSFGDGGANIPRTCTTQPVRWEPAVGRLCDSHLNWQTVEYDGPLFWDVNDGHSNPLADDDYNFWLGVRGPATLTTASPQVLQLEFNSGETIDHFRSPWWEAFHAAVDDGRGTVVDTDYAIVIGLLGLDCEHSCGTEIHPVYAMAIHDPVRRPPDDDVWAIFVRNWGDEGFCASGLNTVSLTSISFRIPWRSGATSVTIKPSVDCKTPAGPNTQFCTNNSDQTSWSWNPLPNNEGVLVTFTLPPPPLGGFFGTHINGELHLQWSGPGLSDPCASLRARLTALQDALNQIYTSIPGNKAEIPGVQEAAQRRIEEWHRAHDEEVARLSQQLAACENRPWPGSTAALRVAQPAEERTPELRLQELINNLPPAQRQLAVGRIKEIKSISEDNKTPIHRPASVLALPSGGMTREPIRDAVTSNPTKTENDRRRREILCTAFSNSIPGFPGFCR